MCDSFTVSSYSAREYQNGNKNKTVGTLYKCTQKYTREKYTATQKADIMHSPRVLTTGVRPDATDLSVIYP